MAAQCRTVTNDVCSGCFAYSRITAGSNSGVRCFDPLLPPEFVQNPNCMPRLPRRRGTLVGSLGSQNRVGHTQTDRQLPCSFISFCSMLCCTKPGNYTGSGTSQRVDLPTSLVFECFRSMAEVVLCQTLFSNLREENVDLDELAAIVSGSSGRNQGTEYKVQAAQDLANKICEYMLSPFPQTTPDPKIEALESQVQILQQQLARFEGTPSPKQVCSISDNRYPASR